MAPKKDKKQQVVYKPKNQQSTQQQQESQSTQQVFDGTSGFKDQHSQQQQFPSFQEGIQTKNQSQTGTGGGNHQRTRSGMDGNNNQGTGGYNNRQKQQRGKQGGGNQGNNPNQTHQKQDNNQQQQQNQNNNQRRNNHNQRNQQNQGFAPQFMGGVTPQMLAQTPMMMPHMQNIQQMDPNEIEGLLMQMIQLYGHDIMKAQQFGGGMPQNMGGAQQQNRQGGRGGPKNNFYGNQQQQNFMSQQQRGMPPPMPAPQQQQKRVYQPKQQQTSNNAANASQEESKKVEGGNTSSAAAMNAAAQAMPMPAPAQGSIDSMNTSQVQGGSNNMNINNQQQNLIQGAQPNAQPQQQQMKAAQMEFARNLCEEHFPEPIICFLKKPLCKKCIPEYIQKQQSDQKKQGRKFNDQQINQIASVLGINSMAMNAYQTEKNKISRSLERILNFAREYRFMCDEIKERENQSNTYLQELPTQMNSMFDKLDELSQKNKLTFQNELSEVIRKQQNLLRKDMQVKLPTFYQRLSDKYQQLQEATQLAQQMGVSELIQVLQQYLRIFRDLDGEFEKYFNDYENVSKLQRLLDKDSNEIIRDFVDLVERNLRVDYNIKNSFGPQMPQRLHSFQWNQRCSQIYKIKTGIFEKKMVTMQYEVPLYSRSIATESGQIYLIGGYIKRLNMYLKNCSRYDEIFGTLQRVANMHYPHADHSVCAIEGFIYVVGTFVNNQVYPYCERYDTQKDKWKQIADMRVPRTGVALCSFKNQYLFAFGGRVDQKRIVDTIEVYDIKRDVWQEIATPLVDKSKWVASYMGLAYQITDNEIMIFGGKSAITFQIFNGCFVFDIEKMVVKERGSLVNPCSFMNTPLVFNNNMYAFGNDIYVHKYNIPQQEWSVILKTVQ